MEWGLGEFSQWETKAGVQGGLGSCSLRLTEHRQAWGSLHLDGGLDHGDAESR